MQDIGLCVPLTLDSGTLNTTKYGGGCSENQGAIVATVESSSISACSAKSTVSKGKFQDLCIRFTDDFNHFLDDWKPDREAGWTTVKPNHGRLKWVDLRLITAVKGVLNRNYSNTKAWVLNC